MKCHILFSGKNEKNINLSSAENAQRVVKAKLPLHTQFEQWDSENRWALFYTPQKIGLYTSCDFLTYDQYHVLKAKMIHCTAVVDAVDVRAMQSCLGLSTQKAGLVWARLELTTFSTADKCSNCSTVDLLLWLGKHLFHCSFMNLIIQANTFTNSYMVTSYKHQSYFFMYITPNNILMMSTS